MEEKQNTTNGIDVRLSHLTKEFVEKSGKVTVAVNDFDVVIPGGKLIGLLGPSGCGKSTTLYMIAGLHRPTSGQIYFGDEDVTLYPPEKRGIGLVFQNYALYPHLTVKQNIMFPLDNVRPRLPKDEILERTIKVANLVQIGDLLERKPNQLSGGQQQRVAIARALVKAPKVLLLDEPLSNLDARLRLQTREEIKRIQRETGITTIFVTHDQEEAMSISDEIVVMKFGVEQQKGAPQKVYEDPVNQFVAKFLGTPPINIFNGYIHDGGLFIGDEKIQDIELENQEVTIGIRPEGFEVSEEGTMNIHVKQIERIGRDMSVIAVNPFSEKDTFRFIIESDVELQENTDIKVLVKPRKCFVFHKVTEERLQ